MVQIEDTDRNEDLEKKIEEIPRKTSNILCCNMTRHLILILTLTCLTLLQVNSLTFNFTVICMSDIVDDYHLHNVNGTHWFEDSSKKSLVFSSMAVGGLLGLLVAVPVMHRFGVRNLLTLCGIFSTLGTILFPLAVEWTYFSVLVVRFLQGLGISLVFTVLGSVPVAWAPKNESSTFLAVLSCAFQTSNVICMPISGILCESSLGWRSIYYVFGVFTIIFFILFYFFYTDSPRDHRNVSTKELNLISQDKTNSHKEAVPYWPICKDPCVLVTWLSNIGGNLGFLTLVLYGPTYLREVLHFEVQGTGFASALPFLLSAAAKSLAGQLSDRCDFVSERVRFTICGIIARLGLALGYIAMAMTTNRTIAQIAFTFSIAVSGLNIMGTVKCLQLRCKQHVHFAVSAIALMAYVIQFGAPILVSIMCPDNSPEQWSRMFFIIGIIVFITSAPFPWFTTAEPADYTLTKEQQAALEKAKAMEVEECYA
uniref:MFS domain-containing protein n=2 Tax=Caenorhabditis japonica TaxID=281687 RepID=A0A8R1HG78_CAEJA